MFRTEYVAAVLARVSIRRTDAISTVGAGNHVLRANRLVARVTRRRVFFAVRPTADRTVDGVSSTDGLVVRFASDEVSLTRNFATDRAGLRVVVADRRFTDVARPEVVCRVVAVAVRAVPRVIRTQGPIDVDGVVTVADTEPAIADDALAEVIRAGRIPTEITLLSVVEAVMFAVRLTDE